MLLANVGRALLVDLALALRILIYFGIDVVPALNRTDLWVKDD